MFINANWESIHYGKFERKHYFIYCFTCEEVLAHFLVRNYHLNIYLVNINLIKSYNTTAKKRTEF